MIMKLEHNCFNNPGIFIDNGNGKNQASKESRYLSMTGAKYRCSRVNTLAANNSGVSSGNTGQMA